MVTYRSLANYFAGTITRSRLNPSSLPDTKNLYLMQQDSSFTKQETPGVEPERGEPDKCDAKPETASADLQKQLNLEPTAIVLAKVKGYRAWPAMVMDEAILPENIRKVKPKSVRLARKPTQPVIVVPVRFFSDDTYIWIKSCDLKVLSAADIDAFLVKRANAKKHDTLIDAYKLAQNPPDMQEFNTWGSLGQPPRAESADESGTSESEAGNTEPERKKLKLTIKLKKPSSSRSSTSGKLSGSSKKTPAKQALKSERSVAQAPKKGSNGHKKEVVPEQVESPKMASNMLEGFDSDWGLEETQYDMDDGDYIFDDELQQREFSQTFPRAADLNATLEQFQEVFGEFHRALSPVLLQEDADGAESERKVVAKLRDLERLMAKADAPLIAFTKSPLFRVMLLTMHKPTASFPHQAIRDGIARVLNQLGLHVCEITENDMVVETKDSTPALSEGRAEVEVGAAE